MISDSVKLQGLTFGMMVMALVLAYYVMYLVLKHIQATDFIWFLWTISIIFGFTVAVVKASSENYHNRIKKLEERIDFLEGKR